MTLAESFEGSLRRLTRHPDVALIPFVFDVLALGLILAMVVLLGGEPAFQLGDLIRPNLPASLPEPLPSVDYVGSPVGVLFASTPIHLAIVAVGLLAATPIRAYGTAGFVGVLYHRVHKGLGHQARSFFDYSHRFLGPILLLQVVFTLLFIPALYIFLYSPTLAVGYAAAALLAYALMLFAPYAVVADGASLRDALGRSAKIVVTNAVVTVPMVAIGLVVTGGFAVLARELIATLGVWGYLAAGLLFSPVGTVVSLLFLSVYTGLRGSPFAPDAGIDPGASI